MGPVLFRNLFLAPSLVWGRRSRIFGESERAVGHRSLSLSTFIYKMSATFVAGSEGTREVRSPVSLFPSEE